MIPSFRSRLWKYLFPLLLLFLFLLLQACRSCLRLPMKILSDTLSISAHCAHLLQTPACSQTRDSQLVPLPSCLGSEKEMRRQILPDGSLRHFQQALPCRAQILREDSALRHHALPGRMLSAGRMSTVPPPALCRLPPCLPPWLLRAALQSLHQISSPDISSQISRVRFHLSSPPKSLPDSFSLQLSCTSCFQTHLSRSVLSPSSCSRLSLCQTRILHGNRWVCPLPACILFLFLFLHG